MTATDVWASLAQVVKDTSVHPALIKNVRAGQYHSQRRILHFELLLVGVAVQGLYGCLHRGLTRDGGYYDCTIHYPKRALAYNK